MKPRLVRDNLRIATIKVILWNLNITLNNKFIKRLEEPIPGLSMSLESQLLTKPGPKVQAISPKLRKRSSLKNMRESNWLTLITTQSLKSRMLWEKTTASTRSGLRIVMALTKNGLSWLFLEDQQDPRDLWRCPISLQMDASSDGKLLLMMVECQFW